MDSGNIIIRGAREHNLKGIDLDLPRGKLIVFTGVSGSGKSSLAFDTLYAEGQRRYVESLSAYARQFLGQLEKPRYTLLRGLSPTIAIAQSGQSHNPRSTVGTITEILDYLRVLYARAGVQHCHTCDRVMNRQSAQEIVQTLMQLPEGSKYSLLAPIDAPPGKSRDALLEARKRGFVRARIDGSVHSLEEVPTLDARIAHRIELVVDRLVQKEGMRQRLTDSVETALKQSGGLVILALADGTEHTFTETSSCPACGTVVPEKTRQLFSFNHPQGMCPDCEGLGTRLEPDPDRVVPDPSLSIAQGAVVPWANAFERQEGATFAVLSTALKSLDIDVDAPFEELPAAKRQQVLYGAGDLTVEVTWEGERGPTTVQSRFEGAIPGIKRRMRETKSDDARRVYMEYLSQAPCASCDGQRLRPEALAVRLGGRSIAAMQRLSLEDCAGFLSGLEFQGTTARVAAELLKEVHSRLEFLLDVGLGYLTLDRPGPSLSGGEAQRIRLASQLGSELTGVLYVLDEPSIGLHPRDNDRLLATLRQLREQGNTVLVVEHDRDTIEAADLVVDFGPGAGPRGGEVLYAGPPEGVKEAPRSLTGAYLSGARRIDPPEHRRPAPQAWLEVLGAREHNLQDIDVRIPLGRFVAVTGVSGAGKSTLINDILYPALASRLHGSSRPAGAHRDLIGVERIDKVIHIDQAPIGRSPRSIPATYVKVLDPIRRLFAQLPEAKVRGYTENRFSFNVKGGRCEACQGEGVRRIEMYFLADLLVPCEICQGRRFNDATLEIKYKGLSIADMLEQSVDQVYALLRNHPQISRILFTMVEVGLGYLSLGQAATTLSGGEAQRLKLSRELARADTGRTLYLLDEPTTGLHFDDVARLLTVLERLVEAGNTVVVIEHNLDVIRWAEHVIDIGPEGGQGGGRVVGAGSPAEIAGLEGSYTGRALRAAGV